MNAEKRSRLRKDQRQVAISGGFDDIRSPDLRFFEEASKLGEVTVLVWPDDAIQSVTARPPTVPPSRRARGSQPAGITA